MKDLKAALEGGGGGMNESAFKKRLEDETRKLRFESADRLVSPLPSLAPLLPPSPSFSLSLPFSLPHSFTLFDETCKLRFEYAAASSPPSLPTLARSLFLSV